MVMALLLVVCILSFIPVKLPKYKYFVVALEILTIIVIFAGNNSTGDQLNYSYAYTSGNSVYFEIGYATLCRIFNALGFEYFQFKLILILVLCALVIYSYRCFDIALFPIPILIWTLTSFFYEAEQSRFFMAMLIVICGLPLLLKTKIEWKNVLIYCAVVLLACLFHTSAIVYLLFALIPFMKKFDKIRLVVLFLIFLTFAIMLISILNGNDWSLVGNLLYAITKNDRIKLWFNFKTRLGYLECVYYQCLIFLLVNTAYKVIRKKNVSKIEVQFCALMRDVLLLLFLVMPFYMISTDFIRIIRGMLLPSYVAVWIGIKRSWKVPQVLLSVGLIVFALSFNLLRYKTLFPFQNEYFSIMIQQNMWA